MKRIKWFFQEFFRNLFDNKSLSDHELKRKLVKTLGIIIGLNLVVGIAVIFFGPTLGSFLGLLSVHRNDKDKVVSFKPNPPTFSNMPTATNQTSLSLTGFGKSGATVKVFANGPEKGSAVIGGDGLFTLTDIPLNMGRNTLFAKIIDTNGTESEVTKNFTIVVDNQKPKLELTGLKDGDTVRNLDKRIIISGKADKPITLTINDKNAIVKPDNSFEFILGANEGNVEVKIKAVDEAGNITEEKLKLKYVKSGF